MSSGLRAAVVMLLAWAICVVSGFGTEGRAQARPGAPAVTNVRIEPSIPRTGDKIRVSFDLMEDTVRAEVKWSVNGEEVLMSDFDGSQKFVEMDRPIKQGEKVRASITPYDAGGEAGRTVIQEAECSNAPPDIKLVSQNIQGGVYKAKVEAADPEGGQVTLTLEEAPEGMKMDERGNIEWKPEKDKSGRFPVKIKAEDDQAQKSYLTFDVGIKWR